jgi:hypothetical protein
MVTGASTVFDSGEWKSDVASRRNPDGTISFLTSDAQHEYVFASDGANGPSK